MQSLAKTRSFGELEDATVVNDPGTDIAAVQRNDPDPPAASEEMVRRPFACSATAIRVVGKTLPPFVAVPFFHSAESRPDSVDGMLDVGTKMSEFARQHRSASGCVDDPTRTNGAFVTIDGSADLLAIPVVQFDVRYFRRTP